MAEYILVHSYFTTAKQSAASTQASNLCCQVAMAAAFVVLHTSSDAPVMALACTRVVARLFFRATTVS